MSQTRPYYADKGMSAAFYDTVTAADVRLAGDVDIYADLIPANGSVLELGAGTGRIAFALAMRSPAWRSPRPCWPRPPPSRPSLSPRSLAAWNSAAAT
jgi:hypothetical protein